MGFYSAEVGTFIFDMDMLKASLSEEFQETT